MPDAFGALMDAFHAAHSYIEEQEIAGLIGGLRSAAMGAQLHAIAAGAIPVAGMYGVWMALGSGYLGARNNVKRTKFASGYSRGFVMGLLKWDWHHVSDRFGVQRVMHTNHFDESLDGLGAEAYVRALFFGFKVAQGLSDDYKASYLRGLRAVSNPEKGNWTRNDQISYVISLSTVYQKNHMQI